ncbi:MAG: DUF1569 domain-containing protein [Terriglobales bacterium]
MINSGALVAAGWDEAGAPGWEEQPDISIVIVIVIIIAIVIDIDMAAAAGVASNEVFIAFPDHAVFSDRANFQLLSFRRVRIAIIVLNCAVDSYRIASLGAQAPQCLRFSGMNSYLKKLQAELEGAIGSAPPEAMKYAPEGKWNSAQILEHLYLTYLHTNKGIARCLEKGAPLATRATMTHRFGRMVVLFFGYFPTGRKAPERSLPRGTSFDDLRGTISGEIQEMAAGLDECERRFGVHAKVMDHPVLGPLTASQWRKFHWMHGRHHARQIRARTQVESRTMVL